MCDEAVRMVMPVMLMISVDMMTRYPGLFSKEVSNSCVIGLLYSRLFRRCVVFGRYVQRRG